jgi:hypothetical protein
MNKLLFIALRPADAVFAVKSALLEVFITEPVGHIRSKACHTVAELSTTCYRMGEAWPELFSFIAAASKHADPSVRCIVLTLLRRVCDYVGQVTSLRVCALVSLS